MAVEKIALLVQEFVAVFFSARIRRDVLLSVPYGNFVYNQARFHGPPGSSGSVLDKNFANRSRFCVGSSIFAFLLSTITVKP